MSGAAAGYLNKDFYHLDDGVEQTGMYFEDFKDIVKTSFKEQAENGMLELVFHRIHLIGIAVK